MGLSITLPSLLNWYHEMLFNKPDLIFTRKPDIELIGCAHMWQLNGSIYTLHGYLFSIIQWHQISQWIFINFYTTGLLGVEKLYTMKTFVWRLLFSTYYFKLLWNSNTENFWLEEEEGGNTFWLLYFLYWLHWQWNYITLWKFDKILSRLGLDFSGHSIFYYL